MMITGEALHEPPFYMYTVEVLGCHASGKTRGQARAVLVEMVTELVKRDSQPMRDFEVTITDDGETVYITSNNHARLMAAFLRYQRELHQLSLADVAAELGVKSRTSYTVYEQGKVEPTISKLVELLAVVAPKLKLTVGAGGPSIRAVAPRSRPPRSKRKAA